MTVTAMDNTDGHRLRSGFDYEQLQNVCKRTYFKQNKVSLVACFVWQIFLKKNTK